MENRLSQLQSMIIDAPNDTFLNYAIGLEYWKAGKLQDAYNHFSYLLDYHSDYLPTYYQLGNLYLELNMPEKASEVLRKGVSVAHEQNAAKTLEELQSVLKQVENEDADLDEDDDEEEAFS